MSMTMQMPAAPCLSEATLEKSVSDWTSQVRAASAGCAREVSYQSAFNLCSATRMAWAAYFNRWALNPMLAPESVTTDLEAALKEALAVVASPKLLQKCSGEKLSLLRRFQENIGLRLSFLAILREHGAEAVLAKMKEIEGQYLA